MRKRRVLSFLLALLFAFTPMTGAKGASASGLYTVVDLVAVGDWSESSQMLCTPDGGGLRISTVKKDAVIIVPLDVTMDMTKNEYLGLKISGFPKDAEWNWMLDYYDSNNIWGTVSAKDDYNLNGWFGNYDDSFLIGGHFNWRKKNILACEELDITEIHFTELRFYVQVPAGTEFRIDSLFIGSRTPDSYQGSSTWARAEIEAADKAGMIPADLLNNYQGSITREDFCRLAIRYIEYQSCLPIQAHLNRKGVTPAAPFDDCDRVEVLAAAALGIVKGVGENKFNPKGVLSRAEAAVMLANTCAALGVEIAAAPQTAYSDQSAVRSWARAEINFVSAYDIMLGSNNVFMPEGPYQTQQAFVTFNRMAGNVRVGAIYDVTEPEEIAAALWIPAYTDSTFTDASIVTGFDAYRNQVLTHTLPGGVGNNDVKYVFHTGDTARVANQADGYAVTLPKPFDADFSRSALQSRFTGGDYILKISTETTPYANDANGWGIYLDEWFALYLVEPNFLSANQLVQTRPTQINTDILPGYTVYLYSIKIDQRDNIEYPYYNIAAVRENGTYNRFLMLHCKSQVEFSVYFDEMIASLRFFEAAGQARNDTTPYELVIPDTWNAATRGYYQKLLEQTSVDWGFFTHSLPIDSQYAKNRQTEQTIMETNQGYFRDALNYTPEILPTYNHLYWGDAKVRFSFPLRIANDYAGGDGYNGKPVLQFSYQFTLDNNGGSISGPNLTGQTPVYDILDGRYDGDFRLLAQEIKAYGKPVLFRLNNEMDTNWTSYCGMVSLLDPDIFAWCWERLYRIFEEEGVDNCIWVFNPVFRSSPTSDWGYWLNYLPHDMRLVHMLGLTYYENGNGETLTSFRSLYYELSRRSLPYFQNFPWGIGEFACGSGSEARQRWENGVAVWDYTELYRNREKQAAWVDGMFRVLNNLEDPQNAFARNIKYAVWFSANDFVTINGKSYVLNQYKLGSPLFETLAALRKGLQA